MQRDVRRCCCKHCLKTFQLNFRYNGTKSDTHQAIVDTAMSLFWMRGESVEVTHLDKYQFLAVWSAILVARLWLIG
jgi:transposase-like protein